MSRSIIWLAGAMLLALGAQADAAIVFKVLHRFTDNPDGRTPMAGVVEDAAGNLYGTTEFGGTGCGAVYKVAVDRTVSIVHAFGCGPDDGGGPWSALTLDDDGNLYGATAFGGSSSACNGQGCGTVFKITPGGTETVLHSFQDNGIDGIQPDTALVRDASGNLYGAALLGGAHGRGTVFKIAPDGTETVIHAFAGEESGDTGSPNSLIVDRDGNLYGTTAPWDRADCSQLCGAVFKITPDGTESVLHAFTGGADGAQPYGLMVDPRGNLYGTTTVGGVGFGTVFTIAADGNFHVMYSFAGGSDGDGPSGPMAMDKNRNLYGMTLRGGETCFGGRGCGTIFKIAPAGIHSVYHRFTRRQGYAPASGLMKDKHGRFYGTAPQTSPAPLYGSLFLFKP